MVCYRGRDRIWGLDLEERRETEDMKMSYLFQDRHRQQIPREWWDLVAETKDEVMRKAVRDYLYDLLEPGSGKEERPQQAVFDRHGDRIGRLDFEERREREELHLTFFNLIICFLL